MLGGFLVVAGGLLGLAPVTAARVVGRVRIWPAPRHLSTDVLRACRVVGFAIAALGLAVLMPALT